MQQSAAATFFFLSSSKRRRRRRISIRDQLAALVYFYARVLEVFCDVSILYFRWDERVLMIVFGICVMLLSRLVMLPMPWNGYPTLGNMTSSAMADNEPSVEISQYLPCTYVKRNFFPISWELRFNFPFQCTAISLG